MGRNEFAEDCWNFELWLYEQPNVPQCCLSLQDRYDADVVLLLLSAWLGMKSCVLSKADIHEAVTQVAPWRSTIVKCVRGVRRNFGSLTYPKGFGLSQLYEQIKLLELKAERIEAALLVSNFTLRLSSMQRNTSNAKIIEDNMLTYLAELVPGRERERLTEEIAPIILACAHYERSLQSDCAPTDIVAEHSARTRHADLTARIGAFLDENNIMSLATSGSTGVHAANLLYARDKLSLIWLSEPDTLLSQNIESNKQVAATVAAPIVDFGAIKSIQVHGAAQRKHIDNGGARLLRLLKDKYPSLRERVHNSEAVHTALQRAEVYLLEPSSITFVDNTKTFTYKEIVGL